MAVMADHRGCDQFMIVKSTQDGGRNSPYCPIEIVFG